MALSPPPPFSRRAAQDWHQIDSGNYLCRTHGYEQCVKRIIADDVNTQNDSYSQDQILTTSNQAPRKPCFFLAGRLARVERRPCGIGKSQRGIGDGHQSMVAVAARSSALGVRWDRWDWN